MFIISTIRIKKRVKNNSLDRNPHSILVKCTWFGVILRVGHCVLDTYVPTPIHTDTQLYYYALDRAVSHAIFLRCTKQTNDWWARYIITHHRLNGVNCNFLIYFLLAIFSMAVKYVNSHLLEVKILVRTNFSQK